MESCVISQTSDCFELVLISLTCMQILNKRKLRKLFAELCFFTLSKKEEKKKIYKKFAQKSHFPDLTFCFYFLFLNYRRDFSMTCILDIS